MWDQISVQDQIQIAGYASLIVGYALLLLLVIRHRLGSGRTYRLLEITLLLAGVGMIGLGGMASLPGQWGDYLWDRWAEGTLIVVALLTAEFADAFVQHPARPWLWRALIAGLVLIALVLDSLPIPWAAIGGRVMGLPVDGLELATLCLALAWAVGTGRAWLTGVGALRRATGAKHRNRIHYLLAALVGFTVGDLLVLVGKDPHIYVGLAARLLGFTIAVFALLRYDLPDIKRLSLNTLCFVTLSSLTAFLYLAVIMAIAFVTGIIPNGLRWLHVLPAVVLALLLAAGLDMFLRPRLESLLNRLVLGQTRDVQKALRVYSQQINLILDPERLADTTLDWLRAALGVRNSSFILFTPRADDQVELRVLRARTNPVPAPQLFGTSSRFFLHFCNVRRPLSQYDLDMLSWFKSIPAAERQWLQALGLDLYIPILVADRPVALLALGPKARGRPYDDEDIEALMTLAGQTGTALENARLLDDLRAVQDDLHRVGTQLTETNQQLKRLDQTKTDFITIASHELRTPLTQIYGYSDILTRLQGDDLSDAEVVHQFVEGITRGAARLKRVVDAMVDVSLIETGAMRIHPVTLPLGIVVQNAVDTVQAAACERQLDFVVHDFAHLPYIQADSARLEQVLVGLLNNAVKFTPDGGEIVVSGRLTSVSGTNSYVELTVTDNGIGIDPEHQDLIFGKFHRAEDILHHSTDDIAFKGAGPGLGLSIAKGIVEAHGGRIWVESDGRDEERCPGSTFYIHLPVNGLEEDADGV